MKLNFPSISTGYISAQAEANKTLNSEILNILAQENIEDYSGPFPQRIPRLGFFQELEKFETPAGSKAISEYKTIVHERIKRNPSNKSLLNFGLRMGLGSEILDLLPTFDNANELSEENIELSLIRDFAETQVKYPNIPKRSLCTLVALFIRSLDLKNDYLSSRIGNRILVKSTRYSKEKLDSTILLQIDETIQNHLLHETKNNASALRNSVLMRGYAMFPTIDKKTVQIRVNHSLALLEEFSPQTRLEELLKKELLYTTLLTHAKTEISFGNAALGCTSLSKLTELDTHDSVGWSEFGLHYSKSQDYAKALPFFESAAELGPPSLSLNCYFAGFCEFKVNRAVQAVEWMEKSIQYDPLALSPRLDLISHHTGTHDTRLTKNIALEIVGNSDLKSQLTAAELINIQKLASSDEI